MGRMWSAVMPWSALAVMVFAGTAAAQQQGQVTLTAELTGAAEAPSAGETNGSGTASITLEPAKGQVCYDITVSNIQNATAAHIHEGAEAKAGPPVVMLKPPANGHVKGCASAKASVIAAIAKDPSGYYVNVHDKKFPKGAIRGQLERTM
ncbi:MAG TPA: CHRD domain-containing protein [Gemmatimonadaceae bacterium]|nr:CHRD domain-containing protein [Gemmatimonadaceae bacterium]